MCCICVDYYNRGIPQSIFTCFFTCISLQSPLLDTFNNRPNKVKLTFMSPPCPFSANAAYERTPM